MSTKSISLLAALVAALALPLHATVKFQSNTIKYRDAGKKPATGRSGSAELQARALVNRDLSADLELTTGSFEPRRSTGNIDKVQIKSESTGTINDNHLVNDGTYSIHVDGVGRGQTIDVLALVSGIDGRRTDVVTLTETAKLRPDLAVLDIGAPAAIAPGSSTLISASVRELNADVGARADCVLRVNGSVVDEAGGIWIDAGSAVSCSFLHTFGAAGHAQVEVTLTDVDPGDYDLGNNTLRKTVQVIAPEQSMPLWGAGAWESEIRAQYISQASWGYRSEYRQSGWSNSTWFHAIWEENLDFSTLKATYVEKTGDTILVELRDMPLRRDDSAFVGSGRAQCMVGVTELISAVICQRPEIPGDWYEPTRPAFINPMFERRAGDVTYFSREWGYTSPGGTWVDNEDSGRDTYGNQTRLGSRMSLEVEISDATRRYAERPTWTLQTSETQSDSPWFCWNLYWCGESRYWRRDTWGHTSSED